MSLRPLAISLTTAAALAGCGGGSATLPSGGAAAAPRHSRPATRAFRGWLQPGLDATHSGDNRSETTVGTQNAGTLSVGWSFPTGAGILTPILTDGPTAYAASGDDYLYAIDIASATQKWRFQTYYYGETGSWIAIAGSRIFAAPCFPDGNSNQAGLCALSASTGKLKWTWYANCNCTLEPSIVTGPVISGSTLVFAYRSGGPYGRDYLVALDASTGGTLWQTVAGGGNPSGSMGSSVPAVSVGNVYIGTDRGVCSLQLSNGSLNWCSGPGNLATSLAVGRGTVYATTAQYNLGSFYAYDATTGAQIWHYTPASGYYFADQDPPAIAGNKVYFSANQGGPIYALNAAKGKLLFTAGGGNQAADVLSPPSVANGVVYAGCYAGLCAYDASTGTQLLGSGAQGTHAAPAIANGEVFNVCWSGSGPSFNVCAYRL